MCIYLVINMTCVFKSRKINSSNNAGIYLMQMNFFPKWKISEISRHYLMHIFYVIIDKSTVSNDNKNTYVDSLQ